MHTEQQEHIYSCGSWNWYNHFGKQFTFHFVRNIQRYIHGPANSYPKETPAYGTPWEGYKNIQMFRGDKNPSTGKRDKSIFENHYGVLYSSENKWVSFTNEWDEF